MMDVMNLDGLRMKVTGTSELSDVSTSTILTFGQEGRNIYGQYGGGSVTRGYLLGSFTDSMRGVFKYIQINESGDIDVGHSEFTIDHSKSGKVRLIECYSWTSRIGGGVNIFEEIDAT